MTDLPPGEWSNLVVGHQWPASTSLEVLAVANTNRNDIGQSYESYASQLASIRNGSLAVQVGVAAEHARATFLIGENGARNTSERNVISAAAYSSARDSLLELRSNLREIAHRANEEIHQINLAKHPAQTKLDKIVAVVAARQSEANLKAAIHGANIMEAIQRVLDTAEVDLSAREFLRTNGVELDTLYSACSSDMIRDQASTLLSRPSSPSSDAQSLAAVTAAGSTARWHPHSPDERASPSPLVVATSSGNSASITPTHPSPPGDIPLQAAVNTGSITSFSQLEGPSVTNPVAAKGVTSFNQAIPESAVPISISDHQSMVHSEPHLASGSPPLTPTDLAHSFNAGTQAGAPVSIGAEATSANAVHTAHQSPTHTPVMSTPPVPPTVPLTSGTETAVVHASVEPAAAPTVIAAPQPQVPAAAPTPPPIAVSAPAPPAGALPAYGADLRAPAATVPAASPTPAAPASAHLASSQTTGLGQPSVVRHQSAPQSAATATALTERAVAATAAGSIAGAAAGHSTAQQRLRQLLASVARQTPKLGWSIGDRSDQTTLLTTDFASGWIPPKIRIPSGVTLLEPGKRSGSLTSMLGETTLTATYLPGQLLPQDNGDIPPTSIRPRKTTPVDELNWELAQATKWRDGLPRLAHTLARAIASGTGYLESEVRLLQEALDGAERRALDTYPNTDPGLIGNWQLLATIDALVSKETICANYHLAWFRVLSSTGGDEQ